MSDRVVDGVERALQRAEERADRAETERDLALAGQARWAFAAILLCCAVVFTGTAWAVAEFKANAALARLASSAWDTVGCR